MAKKQFPEPNLSIEYGRDDIFIIVDGVKIAKRGHPGTPQAKTWVSLEPGWRVLDDAKGGLVIESSPDAPPIH